MIITLPEFHSRPPKGFPIRLGTLSSKGFPASRGLARKNRTSNRDLSQGNFLGRLLLEASLNSQAAGAQLDHPFISPPIPL